MAIPVYSVIVSTVFYFEGFTPKMCLVLRGTAENMADGIAGTQVEPSK